MTVAEIALTIAGLVVAGAGVAAAVLAPRLAAGWSEARRSNVRVERRAPAQARMQALIAGQTQARQRAQQLRGRLRIGGIIVALAGALLVIAGVILVLTSG